MVVDKEEEEEPAPASRVSSNWILSEPRLTSRRGVRVADRQRG
jgi:hypothetical protein